MTILGLEDAPKKATRKAPPMKGLGFKDLIGGEDEIYEPVLGAVYQGDGGSVGTSPPPAKPMSAADVAAQQQATNLIFAQQGAVVDKMIAIQAADQEAAKAKAIADAKAAGATQAQQDAAAQQALLTTAYAHPIIAAPTPAMTKIVTPGGGEIVKPADNPYAVYDKATTLDDYTKIEQGVMIANQKVMDNTTPPTVVSNTGPMNVAVPLSPWDQFWFNWNKGWSDFFASVKTTLGIK